MRWWNIVGAVVLVLGIILTRQWTKAMTDWWVGFLYLIPVFLGAIFYFKLWDNTMGFKIGELFSKRDEILSFGEAFSMWLRSYDKQVLNLGKPTHIGDPIHVGIVVGARVMFENAPGDYKIFWSDVRKGLKTGSARRRGCFDELQIKDITGFSNMRQFLSYQDRIISQRPFTPEDIASLENPEQVAQAVQMTGMINDLNKASPKQEQGTAPVGGKAP